jgi:hypothetical protein
VLASAFALMFPGYSAATFFFDVTSLIHSGIRLLQQLDSTTIFSTSLSISISQRHYFSDLAYYPLELTAVLSDLAHPTQASAILFSTLLSNSILQQYFSTLLTKSSLQQYFFSTLLTKVNITVTFPIVIRITTSN